MPSIAIIGTRGYPSYYGGFETAVRNLVPHLLEMGWTVTVYTREASADGSNQHPHLKIVKTPGIQTKSLSTLTFGATSAIHAAIHRPDVALVMNVANGFWLPILRMRKIPVVVNVDGVEWIREKWGRLARSVFFGGARMTAKFANELIMDARSINEFWISKFKRGGTWIPYGGTKTEPDLSALPAHLEPGKFVLAVARLVPENSINEFLDAAQLLVENDSQVVLVGSSGYGGPLEDRARELDQRLPNFHHLGHVRDDKLLFALWRGCGAYFHGHSVGGTNPALVQAMMLGAPTVARDTVFNREVLGSSGQYVEATGEAIYKALSTLLTNPGMRAQMANSAIARAERHYSWESVNSAYEQLLRETHRAG